MSRPPSRHQRPKVVHVVVAGHLGGAEHFLTNLASRPSLTGVEHSIVLMTPNPKLRAYFIAAGLRIRDRGPVSENSAAYLWRSLGPSEIAWLRNVVLEEGASLVHAHTFGSQVLAARVAGQIGLPLLRTEHGVGVYRDPSRAFLRKWALRRADRVVAVSEFVRRIVEQTDPSVSPRMRVVHNGIDTAHFRPAPFPRDRPFTFSMLTRLERVKRVDLIIEALAGVLDARLEIAGDGSQRKTLERMASRLGVGGHVKFLGYCDDPRGAIAGGDVTINATREEGFPLAVLEAASMERATIAFAGGGIPEVVRDGQTGWLVREYSAAAFARAMSEARADRARARELGGNARALVARSFDVDAMCRGYGTIYGELLAGQRAPSDD